MHEGRSGFLFSLVFLVHNKLLLSKDYLFPIKPSNELQKFKVLLHIKHVPNLVDETEVQVFKKGKKK